MGSSSGPANKPELRNFSAMKSGHRVRLCGLSMHVNSNDDILTRVEHVEAWVLLVKHRNTLEPAMPVIRCLRS